MFRETRCFAWLQFGGLVHPRGRLYVALLSNTDVGNEPSAVAVQAASIVMTQTRNQTGLPSKVQNDNVDKVAPRSRNERFDRIPHRLGRSR